MLDEHREELIEFLKVGKSVCEISEQFSVNQETAEALIKELEDVCDIFPTINREGKRIFLARKRIIKPSVEPKIWKYTVGSDNGEPQPYLIVKIPDDVLWEKIKILIFGDIHYGAKGFDEEMFYAIRKLVLNKEHAFVVINGDLIENALGGSIGGAVYDQVIPPDEQIDGIREMMRPIAHRIFLTIPGNHEWRTFISAGIDPLKNGFCRPLEIPYFKEPVYMDILWQGHVFTFHIQHGKSGAQTKGGKLVVASRPLASSEHTMFTIMGHVHDPISLKNIKRCREYIYYENGEIIGMKTVKKLEYVIINSATYRFFNTYGSRAGYAPTTKDEVHSCVIESNGNFFIEKKRLHFK